MAGERRVVKRAGSARRTKGASVLERAVREILHAISATAVYGYILARDGSYHCVAVAPADHARAPRLDPEAHPQAIDLIYADEVSVLRSWVERDEADDVVVLVPLWDGEGPVGALVIVTRVVPSGSGLRMLAVHGHALGAALAQEHDLDSVRSRAGQLLQANNDITHSLASMYEGWAVVDLDGRVRKWSEGCERLTGWAGHEVLGCVLPACGAERRRSFVRAVRGVASKTEISEIALDVACKDGSSRQTLVHALPLFDRDAKASAVMLMFLREWVASDAGVAPRDEYLASLVVRELTSPLTAVTGYAQLLARSGIAEDPERRERIARNMVARCEEMASLLDDLSLMSGLQSAPRLHVEEVDIAGMVRALVSTRENVGGDGRFSACRIIGSGTALVDRACAERSVLGLLRSLARTCSRDAEVAFTVSSEDERTLLTIDTREKASAAEDLFAELTSLAEQEPVTEAGLGLHLARIVAEAHGGGISITRRQSAAPRVTIEYPAAPKGIPEEERWQTTMM
ncbi:MAG: PAS domain-containing protein [Coriobacteriales bacterium]